MRHKLLYLMINSELKFEVPKVSYSPPWCYLVGSACLAFSMLHVPVRLL